MSADEVFVLMLVLGCVAAVVAAAIHSRKRQQESAASEQPEVAQAAREPEPVREAPKDRRRAGKR